MSGEWIFAGNILINAMLTCWKQDKEQDTLQSKWEQIHYKKSPILPLVLRVLRILRNKTNSVILNIQMEGAQTPIYALAP